MSLHFLFGRAGTGKTARCCAEIARYITEAPGRRAYFLVPDQATFRAESMLAAAFPGGGFADVTVCGFTRLSYRVFQELREDTGEALSSLVQQIILRRLLTERRGELRQMGEAARQPHFSAALSSFFHQLDSFRIGEADLRAAAEEEGETPLGRKLADLSLIFSAYHGYLRSHFRYRGSMYDKLAECIPRSRQIREARVWIDGYSGMTPQETAIVSALAAAAEEVTVTLPMDPPEESAGVPLFDRPFRLWETLSGEAGRTDAAVLTEPHRFTCPRVRELADRFFRPFPKACVYPPATRTLPEQGIYITKAPQPAAEADDAARRIALLVREKGFRWRDILVLLRSDDYAELLRRSFETYRIPAFIDKRRPMKNHPLVVLTDSLLRFLAAGEKGPWQGWTKDLLFPLLKTDLLRAFAPEDTDRLENYVLRTGLRRSQWKSVWKFHSPFHLEDDSGMPTPGELEELNLMNRYRQQLLDFLIPLEDGWREAKTVSGKCALLYRWFMEQRVPDTLARWDEMSFAETRERPHLQVWKKVLSLLDDLVRAAGGDEVSGAELLSMAEDGLSSLTFSIIPPTLDHVTVTAIDRGYAMEAKAVFLLGAEEGVFPARIEEGGLLSEEEKRSLRSSRRLIFGPDLMSLIAQEEFYTYLALTRARQALYISWSAAGADGAEHTPSPLLARLAALGYVTAERTAELPGPATEDRSFLVTPDQALALLPASLREGPPAEGSIWQPLRDWALSRKDTARLLAQKAQGFSYRNEAAPLPAAVVRQLFLRGKPFRTSVTRLETYRACPYQYFLRYGLRLDERDRSRMDARDFGSYLHAGLHSFGEFMKKQQRQWRDADDKEIDAVSRDIAEKVAPRVKSGALLSDAAAQYTKSALDRTFRAALRRFRDWSRSGTADTVAMEADFRLRIETEAKREFFIDCHVDRLDEAAGAAVVCDYKTGTPDLTLSEIAAGYRLQLITYLMAVLESGDQSLLPGALLYIYLRGETRTVPVPAGGAPAEPQKQLAGYFLSDRDFLAALDSRVGTEGSILPVGYTKTGAFTARSPVLTLEEMQALFAMTKQRLAALYESLRAGQVPIRPVRWNKTRSPCAYCLYRSVCRFDPKLPGNAYEEIAAESDSAVREKLRGAPSDPEGQGKESL